MTGNDEDVPENDDDKLDIEDLFPFTIYERDLIHKLATAIRGSLTKLAPAELRLMATFLFALERLPYATEGFYIDLAITQRHANSFSYINVEIGGSAFRLATGESVYSPDVGSDNHSETNLEMEIGGFRDGTTQDFEEWLDKFSFLASDGSYSFEGEDNLDLDLTEEVPADGWDRLAAYWDSQGGGTTMAIRNQAPRVGA